MSVLKTQNSERRVGKGDARHDNLKAFQKGMESVEIPEEWSPRGTIFLKKQNRTIVKYGS
jgi:hypothetical protein